MLSEQAPVLPGRGERYQYDPTVGLDSIGFDPWTTAVLDQGNHNGDDLRSLCFTTGPLPDDWELTGEARVTLPVWASVAGLNYAVKLCDVGPDGTSRLVTMGWRPDPATEAAIRKVVIPLRGTSHVFRPGHRIRLGLALADFPRLWPTPHPGAIELVYGPDSPRLELPRTPPQQPLLAEPALAPPGTRPQSPFELESTQSWRVWRELVSQLVGLSSESHGRYRLRDGGTIHYSHRYTTSVPASDPAATRIQVQSRVEVERPGMTIHVDAVSVFAPEEVTIEARIERDGAEVFRRRWQG
jgi:hypothetical protein